MYNRLWRNPESQILNQAQSHVAPRGLSFKMRIDGQLGIFNDSFLFSDIKEKIPEFSNIALGAKIQQLGKK